MDGCASGKMESLKLETGRAFAGSYVRSCNSGQRVRTLKDASNLFDEEKTTEGEWVIYFVYGYA